MKTVLYVSFFAFFAISAFSQVQKENLDDTFNYRVEDSIPKKSRGIAKENEVEASDDEVTIEEESSRDLAGQEEDQKLQKQNQGVMYWKY